MDNQGTHYKQKLQNILQLIRWHQPAGTWLLFWPCSWSIVMAGSLAGSSLLQILYLIALFFLGALLMRSAGCVINDLWDREIDSQVARTKDRPIASGSVSIFEALAVIFILLSCSLLIVAQLSVSVFWMSLASLPLVMIYPLMKRITYWPQLFLGFTFNFGALMGWSAVTAELIVPVTAWLLYGCGIFWTLGYDTIYALQDCEDDAKIGVKSSALAVGQHPRLVVSCFYAMSAMCLLGALSTVGVFASYIALLILLIFSGLIYSLRELDKVKTSKHLILNSLLGFLILLITVLAVS